MDGVRKLNLEKLVILSVGALQAQEIEDVSEQDCVNLLNPTKSGENSW